MLRCSTSPPFAITLFHNLWVSSLSSENRRHYPTEEETLVHAFSPPAPLHVGWFSQHLVRRLAETDVACDKVHHTLGHVVTRMHTEFATIRSNAHLWQDEMILEAQEIKHANAFFASPSFKAMLHLVQSAHRVGANTMEIISALALLHGERCFYPRLRDLLAFAVKAMMDLSTAVHRIDFALVYKSLYSFWDESTDVNRHVEPFWDVLEAFAKMSDYLYDVKVQIDSVFYDQQGTPLPLQEESGWHDDSGAFSQMNVLQRHLFDGWHLDHGVLTWMLRFWQPPPGSGGGDSCHTSVGDFGAGAGHYCKFLNQTGEICCFAFDGSEHVAQLSDGAVQVQRLDKYFALDRIFDWVLCLEAAEHVPPEAEATFLGNLRRHARKGLVLSWSADADKQHPNARPWSEVRRVVEAAGFVLHEGVTSTMRPRLHWLRGAVHVFLVADTPSTLLAAALGH